VSNLNDQQTAGVAIPNDATARLRDMRQKCFVTSGLSTDEFLLVRDAGFRPVGFVMGVCYYHIKGSSNIDEGTNEATEYSQALYDAREQAMSRLEAEALELGADGVVGVSIEYVWRTSTQVEFIATGTAVVAAEVKDAYPEVSSWRNQQGKPFTSDLSGQSFYKLIVHGYVPVGLVMASCVYYAAQTFRGSMRRLGNIAEITELTQYTYYAREQAMSRMQAEAEELGAHTVVEVRLDEIGDHFGGADDESTRFSEFFAIGTAVRQLSDGHVLVRPQFTLSTDG